MNPIVVKLYNGDLGALVKDLFKYEKIIERWKSKHKGYYAKIIVDIDVDEFYTLTVLCRGPLKK